MTTKDPDLQATAEAMLSVGDTASAPPPGLVRVKAKQSRRKTPAMAPPAEPDDEPTPAQQAIRERFEQSVTIDWYGLRLTVGPYAQWGFQAQYFANRGDDVGVVTAMFGQEQMDTIMASEHANFDTIGELLQAIQEYYSIPGK